jgi:uncharacterized membrane protein
MKISRSNLVKIIQETYRSEREMFYDAGQREEEEEVMRQMNLEDEEMYSDEYEMRREEADEAMRANALDALQSIIGRGIDSAALIGAIRRNRDLNFYSFAAVMDMIDSLEEKQLITGFLGS